MEPLVLSLILIHGDNWTEHKQRLSLTSNQKNMYFF